LQAESSPSRRRRGVGALFVLSLALLVPAAARADRVRIHPITPHTVTTYVVPPSSSAPTPTQASPESPEPDPNAESGPTPLEPMPTMSEWEPKRGSDAPPDNVWFPDPDRIDRHSAPQPQGPMPDDTDCDGGCRLSWAGWARGEAGRLRAIAESTQPTDPNLPLNPLTPGEFYAVGLEIWADQFNDDAVMANAMTRIREVLHPFGPPKPSEPSLEPPPADASTPQPDAVSQVDGQRDEPAASPVDQMYSEVTDELRCPHGDYQGINNGLEDAHGGTGVCF
jgi:hypothetical protein